MNTTLVNIFLGLILGMSININMNTKSILKDIYLIKQHLEIKEKNVHK